MLDFEEIKNKISDVGVSGPHSLFTEKELSEVQSEIYDFSKEYLVPHDDSLSLTEKLRIDLKDTSVQAGKKIKQGAKDGNNVFTNTDKIRFVFEELLETENIVPSYFNAIRANFPNDSVRTGWHQDIESLFTGYSKEIGYQTYTIWISLNAADTNDSIEFLLNSHKSRHIYFQHYQYIERDLNSISPGLEDLPKMKVECKVGDVYFFSPFILHRTTINKNQHARFSLDLRYYSTNKMLSKYSIDKRLYLSRRYQKFRDSKLWRSASRLKSYVYR